MLKGIRGGNRCQDSLRTTHVLVELTVTILVNEVLQIRWERKTGTWIKFHPYTVNGTYLGAQEWIDAIFLLYGIEPPCITKI